jgi:post-segregation antitoxin (ccd killing protein)
MTLYTEFIGFKISKTQKQTMDKLKGYNVNVSQFVRNAIKEKIERDYDDLKEKSKKEYCPF